MTISSLQTYVNETSKRLANKMDDCLVQFFGSEELVKAYAHLYVLEYEHIPIETMYQQELSGDRLGVRVSAKVRIRPKTLAEMEAEGISV